MLHNSFWMLIELDLVEFSPEKISPLPNSPFFFFPLEEMEGGEWNLIEKHKADSLS